MDTVSFLLDILKYTFSGILVVMAAYFLMKNQFDAYYNIKELEYKTGLLKEMLPLRLQAYERMAIFVERINPSNLIIRLHQPGMSAQQLHQLMLTELRAEYQHNVSQQIYISHNSWEIIKRVKEDTLIVLNVAVQKLPENASALDFSKLVFSELEGLENNPYDLALLVLKKDIEEF